MKYLNNNDLYFRLGDLSASTGYTPTYTNVTYSLDVSDPTTTTVIKSYSGSIFFHSFDQKVYYDFLIDSMISDIDIETFPQSFITVPIVNVSLTFMGTYSANTQVARTVLTDDMTESVVDNIIYPTGGTYPHFIKPENFGCDKPRLIDGMHFPAIVATGTYSVPVSGNTDLVYDGTQSYLMLENGCYIFKLPMQYNTMYIKRNGRVQYDNQIITDYCEAPYMLLWFDQQGFFQSQPFWGNESEDYTHNTLTNLNGQESKYQTQGKRKWSLKSDWVQTQKTYQSLFTSPIIYLYDGETGKYHKVLIKDTNFAYKRSRKAFRFSVNVNKDYSTVYRN